MWGEMGRDGTGSGWHGEARAETKASARMGAMSPHATAFLWLPPLTSHFPCATISQAPPKALCHGRPLPWGDGEIWARYGRDMGEIWGRYEGDMGIYGEIWGDRRACITSCEPSAMSSASRGAMVVVLPG